MTYLAKYSNLQMTQKFFRKVTNDTDKQSLQGDLDKLVKWSEKKLLNFGVPQGSVYCF